MERLQNFIDGKYCDPVGGQYIDNYEQMSAEEIAIISKHCEHKHDSHYSYRKRYFKNHPDHTLEDFHHPWSGVYYIPCDDSDQGRIKPKPWSLSFNFKITTS